MTESIKGYLKDKDYPLDERFKVLTNCGLTLKEDYDSQLNGMDFTDFMYEPRKFQSWTAEELVECLIDAINDEDCNISEDVIDETKEYLCQKGMTRLTYDW